MSLVEAANSGYWYCRSCERISQPTNDDPGDVFKTCYLCGADDLKFFPPVPKPDDFYSKPLATIHGRA